jgi:phosphoribosylformylglycinamidine synthase subunit PurQ / glutaminase
MRSRATGCSGGRVAPASSDYPLVMTPTAVVIRAAGTNCDQEMVRGFMLAGAATELLHLDRVLADPSRLGKYDIIGFAGGFSYGDDCGAGRVQAVKIRERLLPHLRASVARGVPMIGACNGFQVLVQTGLLPGGDAGAGGEAWTPQQQTTALANNEGGRFIDAWVPVAYEPGSVCLWTRGLAELPEDDTAMLPIAHGEGRFVAASDEVLRGLERAGQVALRYRQNVNGSMGNVAGICDPTGRVFGLMPHPERYLAWENHPWWTRLDERARRGPTPGLRMFMNAVEAVRLSPVG